MSTLGQLLAGSRPVVALSSGSTVHDAIATMVLHDISAVAVLHTDALVGIVTERDLVRKMFSSGRTPERLGEIMTSQLITVSPADSAEACMALMIENHIRHLPVLERGRLVGMLSMRDLVRHVLAEKEFLIAQMTDYISGTPTAPRTQ